MTLKKTIHTALLLIAITFSMVMYATSQTALLSAVTRPPVTRDTQWEIEFAFNAPLTLTVHKIYLLDSNARSEITVSKKSMKPIPGSGMPPIGFTVLTPGEIDPVNRSYALVIELVDPQAPTGTEPASLQFNISVADFNLAQNHVKKAPAKDVDDSNLFISGEIHGAHKEKTRYSTEISLSPGEIKVAKNTFITPIFFKLNASTDPDADPDSMEFGLTYRRRFLDPKPFPDANFTTTAKIESERDFGNTNFISDTRLTLFPKAFPKGPQEKLKIFFRPFFGLETGKNLRSPLAAAEGDFIFRPLAGARLRVNYPVSKDEEREINWETAYTRRWLLSKELGFRTNDDDELVLTEYGRSPRDYVQSKFSYGLAKFLDVFIAYEWGQTPPSYKFLDHTFRAGFTYKFKQIIK